MAGMKAGKGVYCALCVLLTGLPPPLHRPERAPPLHLRHPPDHGIRAPPPADTVRIAVSVEPSVVLTISTPAMKNADVHFATAFMMMVQAL
ncbi:hypothetical protein LOC54_07725 [Acetobacter sp. AN02]|uniref:hypothetical protein n=1 Tax=Acetobacter sp. AN02 TaxID=2894186 RepID=UPI0024345123|nr:hypothetical protein [Acetobacter sp. AN02]MDG6094996.1 hypothetical protein [Acetobacter sp. AN02]